MNKNVRAKTQALRAPLRGLSIQQKLPLLICILLLFVVVALGWLSLIGVKRAALDMGKERLGSLTAQLTSLYGQSAALIVAATRSSAAQEPIKKMLRSNNGETDSAALQLLHKLRFDSTWVLVELCNTNRECILRSAPPGMNIALNFPEALSAVKLAPDSCKVGKLCRFKDSIYFPIIAAVTENNAITGYLVRWRRQLATSKALGQFSQLLGTNATIYMGNTDGSLWTDMIRPVSAPPVQTASGDLFFQYSRHDGPVIASAQPIPHTQWVMLIEFSQQIILESSRRFLHWIISIGAVVVIIGILLGWLISRNITRPLNKLTAATTAMAAGDYTMSVEVDRRDELGKLARAFNAMKFKVKNAQDNLEKKVQERTDQLNAVNKELEAFSYSVSHDLRAPLRYISGYARILQEDYASNLDAEANRIAGNIVSSAQTMGQLIDDLIAFSKMARKELKHQMIDMRELAASCADELLLQTPPGKYRVDVHSIPPCQGDIALIKQVWINLIGNAIKYSSKNPSPYIEIGFNKEASTPVYFVRDNGAGFDMQYAGKLFGVFQRLHNQDEFEGSGIGLSLVKRIVNRHNGDIYAEAAVGEGATFYFSIPGGQEANSG